MPVPDTYLIDKHCKVEGWYSFRSRTVHGKYLSNGLRRLQQVWEKWNSLLNYLLLVRPWVVIQRRVLIYQSWIDKADFTQRLETSLVHVMPCAAAVACLGYPRLTPKLPTCHVERDLYIISISLKFIYDLLSLNNLLLVTHSIHFFHHGYRTQSAMLRPRRGHDPVH